MLGLTFSCDAHSKAFANHTTPAKLPAQNEEVLE